MNTDIIFTDKLLDGFWGGANGKKSTCQCRRLKKHRFDPWVRKVPWRRAWQPLGCSCLENPTDRGAWRATVHGVTHRVREATDTARHGADFWMSRISDGALVSQGCHNKIPQSWWLAQEKCIVSQFWRQEVCVLGVSRKTEGKSYRVQVD